VGDATLSPLSTDPMPSDRNRFGYSES
jgi:hypothetical protein